MADRAEDTQELAALDRRVDELLSDVEQSAERIDAALPSPPGEDNDSINFETADEALGEASASLSVAYAPPAERAFETADEALAAAASELQASESQPPAPAIAASGDVATPVEAAPELSAAEFASPDAIHKLDERLAASATELSAAAGDVVDDADIEAQVSGTAPDPAVPSATATATPSPAAPAPIAAAAAGVKAAPSQAVAPAAAAKPAPVTVAEIASKPASAAAVATEITAKPAAKPRMSIGDVAAAAIRPLATVTLKLKPGVRQTIGYAAVVTLFQAACLWGFLMFRGPAGEPEATSEPVILRKPGDPPAAHPPAGSHGADASGHGGAKKAEPHGGDAHAKTDSHAKADDHAKPAAKKNASKPKAGATKDAHAAAEHH